jgi:DNA-binding protein HU-beta
MTRFELIAGVSDKSGLSKKDSEKAIKALVDTITRSLGKGESVQLVGFGTWEVHSREARKGRNPRTGAQITIAARKVPVFRAGKALKSAISKK